MERAMMTARGNSRVRRTHRQRVAALAWLAIVAGFALWATLTYRSLAALIGEWEYRHIGQHLPIVTLLVLTIVFGSPALLLLWLRRTRRGNAKAGDGLARTMQAERRLLAVLAWASGLSVCAALAVLCWMLTLPSAQGIVRAVNSSMAAPGEGPVRLSGRLVATRTASFRQNLLFVRRTVRFAPLDAGDRSGTIRYFVEIPIERPEGNGQKISSASYTGILKRDALPGAIIRLFQYAGFAVAKPHYVLFASRSSMLLPYYVTAANWLLAAAITFILMLWQRRRLRGIVRKHPHLNG